MSFPVYATRECDCTAPRGAGYPRPERCKTHRNRFQTEKELAPPKERAPMRRVSEKRQAEYDSGERRNTGSTLKAGNGFAAAPAQRAKVKLLTCLGCGREVDMDDPGRHWTIDPAHLVPRGQGGCDHEDCVLPLCRNLCNPYEGCHPIFDGKVTGKSVDLHSRLAQGGYEKELAHAVGVHGWTPLELVGRVCGEPYVPKSEADEWKARAVELEAHVHA
jgi:hypothetical protein